MYSNKRRLVLLNNSNQSIVDRVIQQNVLLPLWPFISFFVKVLKSWLSDWNRVSERRVFSSVIDSTLTVGGLRHTRRFASWVQQLMEWRETGWVLLLVLLCPLHLLTVFVWTFPLTSSPLSSSKLFEAWPRGGKRSLQDRKPPEDGGFS